MNVRTAFELVENPFNWREPIAKFVSVETLKHAGVTIEEVEEAVMFYTATAATTKSVTAFETGEHCGYYVTAAGYRAGPAGP